MPTYSHPKTINTDKNSSYINAIKQLQDKSKCYVDLEHRQVIKPTLGFKSMKAAYSTIKGFEIMRMFKKGQFELWKYGQTIQGEIRIITNNLLAF